MSIFDLFKKKRKSQSDFDRDACINNVTKEFKKRDFLGEAADAGHRAKAAVNAKDYDKAWELYHEQKSLYMHHANRCKFTIEQILALDSQVHEDLANVMRLEGRNEDALAHILYWVIANSHKPIRRHKQKLTSYFNRCKFKSVTVEEAIRYSISPIGCPDFMVAQSKVKEWVSRG